MRDIKFRAWFARDEKYIKPMTIQNMIHQKVSTFSLSVLYKEVVFEQYTGLKDKNGVEIYEGDIVKVLDGEDVEDPYYSYLEIRYDQGKFYFHNAYAVTFDDVLDDNVLDVEVIGNIHENADLLEEQ